MAENKLAAARRRRKDWMSPETRAIIDADAGPAPDDLEGRMEELKVQADRARELQKADPRLPYISALVMAGDLIQADRSWRWLQQGAEFHVCLTLVGSYGRLDFAVRAMDDARVDPEVIYEQLPALWRGSDPDDTDPRFLALWRDAKAWNGNLYLRDGKALPTGSFYVYRGQDLDAPFGIAWSLKPEIAEKFANGAATRQHNRGGAVYRATATRRLALGYMTGRQEAEVILDPATIDPVYWEGWEE